MFLLPLVLFFQGTPFRNAAGQQALTFSKKPNRTVYQTQGYDVEFEWDFERTERLSSVIWFVFNKTANRAVTLRVEDENGTHSGPSTPPLAYAHRLERKGRGILIVKNVSQEDSKEFGCRLQAKRPLYSATDRVNLVVTGPCRVRQSVQFVNPEGFTRITCNATDVPAQQFKWRKHGETKTLSNDGMHSIVSTTGSSVLTVQNVTDANDGYYICFTVNIQQSCLDTTFLQLVELQKGKTCNMTTYSSGIGNTLTIDCPVMGYPPPVVTWMKNGTKLREGGSTELTFTNLTESDFGLYMCSATNYRSSVGPCSIAVVKDEGRNLTAPKATSSDGTNTKGANLSWQSVEGAKFYVVTIGGDDIYTDRVLGVTTSLEIHYHMLVMTDPAKQPEKLVVRGEVAALNDAGVVQRFLYDDLKNVIIDNEYDSEYEFWDFDYCAGILHSPTCSTRPAKSVCDAFAAKSCSAIPKPVQS